MDKKGSKVKSIRHKKTTIEGGFLAISDLASRASSSGFT